MVLLELHKSKFWPCILFVYSQKSTANIAQQLQARKKSLFALDQIAIYVYPTKQKAAATYFGSYSFWFTILIDFLFISAVKLPRKVT